MFVVIFKLKLHFKLSHTVYTYHETLINSVIYIWLTSQSQLTLSERKLSAIELVLFVKVGLNLRKCVAYPPPHVSFERDFQKKTFTCVIGFNRREYRLLICLLWHANVHRCSVVSKCLCCLTGPWQAASNAMWSNYWGSELWSQTHITWSLVLAAYDFLDP